MTNPNDQKRENIFKHLKEFNKDTTKLFFDLTADEAKALLMTSAHYHNFEMPEYFNFDNVLNHVQNTVGNRPYTECLHQSIDINSCNGVNIDILLNKDGHYAVRPLTLCNPYLYYFMVRTLCTPEAWQSISQNLNACQVPHIMADCLWCRLKWKSSTTAPSYLTGGETWSNAASNWRLTTDICL